MSYRHPKMRSGLAVTAMLLAFTGPAVQADETDAKQILMNMSDYLAAEQNLDFDFDAALEVVTTESQNLSIAVSGTVALSRPDKLHVTRTGGFTEIEMIYNGQQLSMLGKNAGLYALIPIEGSVDHLIDELRDTYGAPLPAADLLTSNAYETLMEDVTDIKDLGAGVIGGRVCDHFAFRGAEVDWQIWISQGDQPFPCRFEIATRDIPGNPRYRVDIRDWRGGETPSNDTFTFEPPAGATEITVEDYTKQFSDLPENFVLGDAK